MKPPVEQPKQGKMDKLKSVAASAAKLLRLKKTEQQVNDAGSMFDGAESDFDGPVERVGTAVSKPESDFAVKAFAIVSVGMCLMYALRNVLCKAKDEVKVPLLSNIEVRME